MDFTGIDGDDLPGLGLHLAASAVRGLRAMADHADAELFVRVACEGPVAARGHGLHAGQGAALHEELACGHGTGRRKAGNAGLAVSRGARAHGKRPGGPRRLAPARPTGLSAGRA